MSIRLDPDAIAFFNGRSGELGIPYQRLINHYLRDCSVWAIVLVGLVLAHGVRVHPETPEYGPAKGSLVIAGGGSLAGTLILENFILLAGGRQRRFIIVPTAEGNRNDDGTVRAYDERRVVEPWTRLGVRNVRMLHTHDPKVADTEQFVEHLDCQPDVVRLGD